MNTLAFVILPYVCLAIFVVGHWWRYKYDKFGWTTRSSQLYEDNLLKWSCRRPRHRPHHPRELDRLGGAQ